MSLFAVLRVPSRRKSSFGIYPRSHAKGHEGRHGDIRPSQRQKTRWPGGAPLTARSVHTLQFFSDLVLCHLAVSKPLSKACPRLPAEPEAPIVNGNERGALARSGFSFWTGKKHFALCLPSRDFAYLRGGKCFCPLRVLATWREKISLKLYPQST